MNPSSANPRRCCDKDEMVAERHEPKPCYFANLIADVNHLENVRYCSICDKWMCNSCRANYPERMKAAANEFKNRALRYAKGMLSSSK